MNAASKSRSQSVAMYHQGVKVGDEMCRVPTIQKSLSQVTDVLRSFSLAFSPFFSFWQSSDWYSHKLDTKSLLSNTEIDLGWLNHFT